FTVGYATPANNYLTNTIKPNSTWDATRYLNIWVSEFEAGILGIATFPSGSTIPDIAGVGESVSVAGVSIGYSTVGSVFVPAGCSQPYGRGRTLTHELGHFFGLRHIWGDATCGNDFCGDTPTHQTSNSGEPTHPKTNTCGTPDEMFENYMDYCNDIAMNLFTINQGDRMTAVFMNSPYRGTLATSNAGLVAPTATNRIAFSDCDGSMTVSELGLTGTYPRYRDVVLPLVIENKATGAASLTVSVGGTAINGYHYQLITPSLSIVNNDEGKNIVLRVFDNAQVDGNKTMIVSYSISGTGVIASSSAQTITVTITDNDVTTPSDSRVTLVSENFDAGVV
ncbi:MAG: hypothetical protein EOO39_50425, partial [Cytophagaceae bacterium]